MPYTPSDPAARTALARQRSGLALTVVAALMLRGGGWPEIAAAAALAGAAVLAARGRLGHRALAMATVGAALLSAVVVATA
jgi:hypothetical protein